MRDNAWTKARLDTNDYMCLKVSYGLNENVSVGYENKTIDLSVSICVAQINGFEDEDGGETLPPVRTLEDLKDQLLSYRPNDTITIQGDILYEGDIVLNRPLTLKIVGSTLTIKGNLRYAYDSKGDFTINTAAAGKLEILQMDEEEIEAGGNFYIDAPESTVKLIGRYSEAKGEADIYVEKVFSAEVSHDTGLFIMRSRICDTTESEKLKTIYLRQDSTLEVDLKTTIGTVMVHNAKDIEKVCKRIEKHYLKHKSSFNFDGMDKKKIRSAWYAAYSSVGRNAPEVIWNGDFWYAGPRERLYGNTLYGYEMDMIEVCKTQDYCDFFLWKFDRTRKNKPVVDGLYFDLWGASSCDRKEHGHGYFDHSGVRKAVHPVREHRRFLELIYLYCKEHANNAPIVCHVSGATAHIAGYSYADYLLDGELWFDKLAEDRSYKSMSLDMARAEILPHIWGPGLIWLSELHRAKGYAPAGEQKTWALEPWAMRHFSGLLLLHDVLPDRTSLFETARKIWLALDKFGLADQDIYLPYWEKCGISGSNDGKKTAITGYLKKAENKMLLVVFNNHDRTIDAAVKLDMKKLFGVSKAAEISDLESGRILFNGKTAFTIPVQQRNFRLLQVKIT